MDQSDERYPTPERGEPGHFLSPLPVRTLIMDASTNGEHIVTLEGAVILPRGSVLELPHGLQVRDGVVVGTRIAVDPPSPRGDRHATVFVDVKLEKPGGTIDRVKE